MEIYEQSKPPIAKWVTFGVLLVLFILDTVLVTTGKTGGIDRPLLDGFMAMRNDFLTSVVKVITFCANTWVIALACFILLVLPTRFRFGAPVSIAVIASAFINIIMKLIIGRPRPDVLHLIDAGSSASFPSGHANTGFVFYILLMILLRRYFFLKGRPGIAWFFTAVLSLLAFGIGVSRIYLGVHYPSDVIGGWLLAGMILIIFMTQYEILYPQRWILTYNQVAWQTMRRRRPWRRPQKSGKDIPMVEFPGMGAWHEPNVSQGRDDEQPNMMLQENLPPEAAHERRRAQMERLREQQQEKQKRKPKKK